MALSLSKSPTDTVDWHKDVWSSSCSLKLKVFLYTILHNVLSLGENLQKDVLELMSITQDVEVWSQQHTPSSLTPLRKGLEFNSNARRSSKSEF